MISGVSCEVHVFDVKKYCSFTWLYKGQTSWLDQGSTWSESITNCKMDKLPGIIQQFSYFPTIIPT